MSMYGIAKEKYAALGDDTEAEGDYTIRLAILEELKSMP